MALFNLLRSWRQSPSVRELEAVVKTLSDRCEPAVWARVEGRTSRMGPAEARGYIRARAAAIVHDQVQRTLRIHPAWQAAVQATVLEEATSQVVRQVHHRLLNLRHPIAERRRAA